LKLSFRLGLVILTKVAPRTGAWIETAREGGLEPPASSPPARGRGLKLGVGMPGIRAARRPPHGGVD